MPPANRATRARIARRFFADCVAGAAASLSMSGDWVSDILAGEGDAEQGSSLRTGSGASNPSQPLSLDPASTRGDTHIHTVSIDTHSPTEWNAPKH